ncbi:hypothetical protein ACQ4PT_056824 [Festuca glaucescens]
MSQGGGGDGVSPGNVPVCYYGAGGRVSASMERRMRAAEVFLRCAACGLAVLAAALLGADSQSRTFFSIHKVARYTDMQSLVNYRLGYRQVTSRLAAAVLLVMAYVIIGAVAVAMEAALIGKYGQAEFQWMKTCHLYQRFCTQAGGGVACAIAASANMVGISLLSAFNLFRLYGHGKGGSSSSGSK